MANELLHKQAMMNSPLVSIIVPVYNTEKYVSECLNSLIQQSYAHIEIIAVDDGSMDNSLKVLNDISAKDSRLKVFSQLNQGVSATRNLALSKAVGEYVMFVDADDWIDLSTIEECLQAIGDGDVCFFAYIREFANRSLPKPLFPQTHIFSEEECKQLQRRMIGPIDEELANPGMLDSLGTIWGKLYRKEILNGIEFIDLKVIGTAEDSLFNCNVFRKVQKAVYINKAFYHYRKFNSGAETKKYKPQLSQQWNNLFEYMKVTVTDGISQKALYNRIALSIIGLGLNECLSPDTLKKKTDKIAEIINQPHYKEAYQKLDLTHFPIHWKVFFFAAKHNINRVLMLLILCIKKII